MIYILDISYEGDSPTAVRQQRQMLTRVAKRDPWPFFYGLEKDGGKSSAKWEAELDPLVALALAGEDGIEVKRA